MTDINAVRFDRELKKRAAELLLLSILEAKPWHGYEIGKLVEARSEGRQRHGAIGAGALPGA